MPSATDSDIKIDPRTLNRVTTWAIDYFKNPNLGAGKKLPSIEEINKAFPNSGITPEYIQTYLFDKLHITTLEAIAEDSTAVKENPEQLQKEEPTKPTAHPISQNPIKKEQEISPDQEPVKNFQSTINTPVDKAPQVGQLITSLHQELSPKLTQDIGKTLEKSLPTFLRDKMSPTQIKQLSDEIARETAREVLEKIGTASNQQQINTLIADSLTQSIVTHEKIANSIKTKEEKIFEKVLKESQSVTNQNAGGLEKAAVIGRINLVLQKPTVETQQKIENAAVDAVELHTPLASPQNKGQIIREAYSFVAVYQNNFTRLITPQLKSGSIPTFENLTKVQDSAFLTASQKAPTASRHNLDSRIGFILGLKNDPTAQEAAGLGSAQPTFSTFTQSVPFIGKGVGFALNSDKAKEEAYYALLTHDKEKFNKTLKQISETIEAMKQKKSLTYRERKINYQNQKNLQVLFKARQFSTQKARQAQTYLSYFQMFRPPQGGSGLVWASQNTWHTTNSLFNNSSGSYSPQSALTVPLFAQRSFGALAFQTGNFRLSNIKSLFGKSMTFGPKSGMAIRKTALGKASLPMMIAMPAINFVGKIAKGVAAVGALAMLYFLHLGMAAALGAMVGGTIGFAVGATAGATIGATIGSVLIPIPIVGTVIGGVVGGVIGGMIGGAIGTIAGGLIGYGIASGSSTLIGGGIGAAAGGAIGAVAGYGAGFAIGSGLVLACGSIFAPCFALLPIAGPLGGMIGSAIGAVVGSIIGGVTGLVVGKAFGYIASGFSNAFSVIQNAFTGSGTAVGGSATTVTTTIGGGISGAVSGAGSFLTASAASLFGGFTSAAGSLFGFASSTLSSIIGGIGGLSLPASMVAIPVIGGVASIGIGTLLVGTFTATSFFTTETDTGISPISENQYVAIKKLVTATELAKGPSASISFPNSGLPEPLKFDLQATAKTDLSNINCSDMAKVIKTSGNNNITTPGIPCPGTLAKDQVFNFTFTITASGTQYEDALVANTFTFSATGNDGNSFSLSTSVNVAIGNAPVGDPGTIGPGNPACPAGWPFTPTQSSYISQGPEGPADHSWLNLEAIDMPVPLGTQVLSTIEGDVGTPIDAFPLDSRVPVVPSGVCPNLQVVWFYHLSTVAVTPGQHIRRGDLIGFSGTYNGPLCAIVACGPHLHYQFNNSGRAFKLEFPYIPKNLSARSCEEGILDCGVTIP